MRLVALSERSPESLPVTEREHALDATGRNVVQFAGHQRRPRIRIGESPSRNRSGGP